MKLPDIKKKIHHKIGERWGFKRKIGVLSIIALLVFCLITSLYFNVKINHPSVIKENKVTQITNILLEINDKQDPDIFKVAANYIEEACADYGMDTDLVLAIIEVESRAEIGAVNSTSGALGLMQVLRTDAQLKKMGIKPSERHRLIHMGDNIYEGVKTLAEGYQENISPKTGKRLDQRDGTTKMALFHYNGVLKNKYDGNKYVADVLSKFYDRECR